MNPTNKQMMKSTVRLPRRLALGFVRLRLTMRFHRKLVMRSSLVLACGLAGLGELAHAAAPFVPSAQPRAWISRPAVSRFNIINNDAVEYRTVYSAARWAGDVVAYDLSSTGIGQPSSPWGSNSFAAEVNTQHYDTGRKIVTLKEDGTPIPFRWASLSATQQASIGNATAGPAILNFVRGDRSNEGTGQNFRTRASVVGDIVQSSLIRWTYGSGTRLFVGANDGMVHVINAADGTEDYAYIPSMLIPNLQRLAANPYTHTYFVDGGMAAATIIAGSTTKSILTGGLGAGGKGLFCLDITGHSPTDETTAASEIKWEITPATAGFANLGYTYGTPQIVRLNNGTYAVVVANGYMNSGNGRASLFIINADTGALIKEIDTGAGSTASPNGLSTPTVVDINYDGKADYAYAGDLDGTMWKFDLSGTDPSTYTATSFYATSPAQAITTKPVVAFHPVSGLMVVFGTGRALTNADMSDTSVHYVYGIWTDAPATNAGLVSHTLTEYVLSSTGLKTRYPGTTAPDYTNATPAQRHLGWKVALPAGERVIGEAPFLNDSRVTFTSTNPTVVNAQLPNGGNWENQMEYLTGAQSSTPVLDLNRNGIFTDDYVGLSANQVPSGRYIADGVVSHPITVDAISATTYTSYLLFNISSETTDGVVSSSSRSSSGSASNTSSTSSTSSGNTSGGNGGAVPSTVICPAGALSFDCYTPAQGTGSIGRLNWRQIIRE